MKIRYKALLILGLFIITAKQAEGQISVVKQYNDSAQYYLDYGRTKKARACIEKAHALKISGKEETRSYLLLGEINDIEGYLQAALSNYRKARQLAIDQKNFTLKAVAANGIGMSLVKLIEMDSVLWYCKESMASDSTSKIKLKNHLVLGQYWERKNERAKALKQYQDAYDEAKMLQDNQATSLALMGMSNIYINKFGDVNRALEYDNKALGVLDSTKHSYLISMLYNRIAHNYIVQGKTKEAKHYLDRAKKIVDISGNLKIKAALLSFHAILKQDDSGLHEVVRYTEEAQIIRRQLGLRQELLVNLANLSEWYIALKQYSEARKAISEGLTLAKELNSVRYLAGYYECLATLDSITGNYSQAYGNIKKAMLYKDSTYAINKIKAVEEVQAKYENEQKERTIAEKELVIQQQKYQQARIIGIAFMLVLTLLVIILWILNRQKIVLQKEKEKQHRLRLQTIVNTQEEVQQNIARDIHDGLVQVLGSAKMSLQAININGDKDVIHERIKNASMIMDEACTEARNISHQILPYSLMQDGLLPALDELLKKNLTDVAYQFHFSGVEKRFDKDVEINMYRIAQELIQNALKHSEATHIEVQLEDVQNRLSLTVKDNGKGFDQSLIKSSVGLMNIKTRAELMNGTFRMDSAAGFGTKVSVAVPL